MHYPINQSVAIAHVTKSLPRFFLSTNRLRSRECIKHGGLSTFKVYSHEPDTEREGKVTLGKTPSQKEDRGRRVEEGRNVLEYLRANAPDHWLAVQPILHRETTKEPTNDLVESKNLLWDEDLFADVMIDADCEESKFAGEIQIPGLF